MVLYFSFPCPINKINVSIHNSPVIKVWTHFECLINLYIEYLCALSLKIEESFVLLAQYSSTSHRANIPEGDVYVV